MKHCDICDIHMQQRSYKRHLTSKRHQEAARAEVPIRSWGRSAHMRNGPKPKPEPTSLDDDIERIRADIERLRVENEQANREADIEQIRREAAEFWEAYRERERIWNERPLAQYETVLGLNKGFTSAELKKAYKRAALRAHPDKGGSTEAFRSVHEAYEYLK
jgi:tryptophan 2,3-dioxygenase